MRQWAKKAKKDKAPHCHMEYLDIISYLDGFWKYSVSSGCLGRWISMASDGDCARPGDRGLGSGDAPMDDISCRDRTGVGDSGGWKSCACDGEACVVVNEYCCSLSWCGCPCAARLAGMPLMQGSEIRVSRSEKSAIRFESGWFSDTVDSDEMREWATELLVDEALV